MSRTNYVTKVCSNIYYTLMKWTEGMSSTFGAAQLRLLDVGRSISAVRDCVPEPEGPRRRKRRRREWI